MKTITKSAINANRERSLKQSEFAVLQAEAMAANQIQQQTGCTRTEALKAAHMLLNK